jgi:hypothetical protein
MHQKHKKSITESFKLTQPVFLKLRTKDYQRAHLKTQWVRGLAYAELRYGVSAYQK